LFLTLKSRLKGNYGSPRSANRLVGFRCRGMLHLSIYSLKLSSHRFPYLP